MFQGEFESSFFIELLILYYFTSLLILSYSNLGYNSIDSTGVMFY